MGLKRMQPPAVEAPSPLCIVNLLKAFRHRWMLAVSVGLALLVLCAGAVGYLVPAKYTSYALLEIRESEPKPLISESGTSSRSAGRYLENTPVAVIKSRPILLAALQRPGIADLNIVRSHADPAAWLEENLKVVFLGETDILRVSLDGSEPKEQALLVNAVKDAYMEREVNGQRKGEMGLLREGREGLKAELPSNKQRVSILKPAAVPTGKIWLEKARLVGFVGAGGFFLGSFSVCCWEARSHRMRSQEDTEQKQRQARSGALRQPGDQAGEGAGQQRSQVRAA
jgi:uncharacterized protein involved in exopolysaccharide biosynthesis